MDRRPNVTRFLVRDTSTGPRGWALQSRGGGEAVRWSCTAVRAARDGPVLVCDVVLTGAGLPAALESGKAEEPAGFTLSFADLEVPLAALARLSAHLSAWLGLSDGERAGRRLEIDCAMGALFDRSLTLRIGERADTVSAGFPVATLTYSAGRLRGELTFLTDEPRLEALRSGLEAAIEPRP